MNILNLQRAAANQKNKVIKYAIDGLLKDVLNEIEGVNKAERDVSVNIEGSEESKGSIEFESPANALLSDMGFNRKRYETGKYEYFARGKGKQELEKLKKWVESERSKNESKTKKQQKEESYKTWKQLDNIVNEIEYGISSAAQVSGVVIPK